MGDLKYVNVVVLEFEIKEKKENIFLMRNGDELLKKVINEFERDLLIEKNNNIDIFCKEDNILVTELGYHVAMFEDEVNYVKNGEYIEIENDGDEF